MIKIDSAEFLDELITRIGDIDDYALAQQAAIPILAKHLGVTPGEIEWRDFRREGYHVDPSGRFFVNGEPVKFKLTPMFEEWENAKGT